MCDRVTGPEDDERGPSELTMTGGKVKGLYGPYEGPGTKGDRPYEKEGHRYVE